MTRNERKAKAALRHQALKVAVAAAERLEAERIAKSSLSYPEETGRTHKQKGLSSRVGIVQRRGSTSVFVARDVKPIEPLKGDWRDRHATAYFGGKRKAR